MVSLPGSYPLDESAPATPDESMQHQLHHPQGLVSRNKPQKPIEPRSYQQPDSSIGFGLGAPAPHQPREQDRLPKDEPLDVVGSGDNYAYKPIAPPRTVDYEPVQNTAPQGTIHSSGQPPNEEYGTANSNKPEIGSTTHGSSDVPPYWGSLPKGQSGGIYNTVTGHGSQTDGHAQHQHIPKSGGIYNTVAGHGSQNEDRQRHNLHAGPGGGATIASTDVVHDAPMAGIPGDKSLHSALSATYIPTSDLEMEFLPENSAQDDTKLLGRSSGFAQAHASSSKAAPAVSSARKHHASGSDTMQQRAFPLGPSNMLSGEDSQEPLRGHHSHDHQGEVLAGIAGSGMGTGIAASADRHEHQVKKEHSTTLEDNHGRNRLSKIDKKSKIASGEAAESHLIGKEKRTQSAERSREDGSPKGEKKHHKILGIFSRHKDDKEPQDTSTTEPAKEHNPSNSGDRKKEAAVGAAAGAGAIGLMSRHKNEQKPLDREAPIEPTSHDEQHHNKLTRKESPQFGSGQGGFLQHHQVHQNTDQIAQDGSSGVVPGSTQTHVNRAQAPTTFDEISRGHQAESTAQVPNYSQPTTADRSRAAPIAAAGLGTAAGLGAYHAAHTHDARNAPQAQSTTTGPSPTTGRSTAYKNSTTASDHAPINPLAYTRVAGLSNTSDSSRGQGVVTACNQPENFNTLSSGTTSGVAVHVLSNQANTGKTRDLHGGVPSSGAAKDTLAQSEPATYNVLASGTPSGVKVEPRSHQGSEDRGRMSGEYNALSSGTASGLNTEQFENRVPIPALVGDGLSQPIPPPIPTRNRDSQEMNQHNSPGFVSVPIISRPPRHSNEHYQDGHYNENRREETADLMRDMGREYASGGKNRYLSNDGSARQKSPEVLPAAQAPTAYSRPSDDPALVAATGAWASSRGPMVDGGIGWSAQHRGAGGKTVLHRCDHCGKDNDITSYLSQ